MSFTAIRRVGQVPRLNWGLCWRLLWAGALWPPAMTETPSGGLHSIAYVTVPSNDVGKTLARKIIDNKLAACVNIIPQVTSIYEWKGEVQEDSEALLMIKTRTSRIEDLIKMVKENHPYEVCEVISTKIDNGNPPYLNWISENVPEIK